MILCLGNSFSIHHIPFILKDIRLFACLRNKPAASRADSASFETPGSLCQHTEHLHSGESVILAWKPPLLTSEGR